MNEHFLTYEQSLAVKELGFNEPCLDSYHHQGKLWGMNLDFQSKVEGACLAPLKSQFFKWVRDKHGLYSSVHKNSYIIEGDMNGEFIRITKLSLKNYEQAEDACINKIIELLKLK